MASCPEMCGADPLERSQTPGAGESSSSSSTATGCHHFGVRSYLHHFYEECAASVWEHRHHDFQSQRSPSCWNSGLWKVCLVFGTLVLAMGLLVFAVGCSIPTRIEAFGEGELLFVDRNAVHFNQGLEASIKAGAGMLCLGGLVVAASLFVSAFSRGPRKEEQLALPPQDRGRERRRGKGAGVSKAPSEPITKPPTPLSADEGVPVTLLHVESIQPSSEEPVSPSSH